jgi:NtrC-family two-component system sensor histidine kinase KinB
MQGLNFKRSLRAKVLFGYLVLISVTGGLGAWAVVNFVTLGGAIGHIMQRNYRSVEAAQNMLESLERQDSAELTYLFGQQEQGRDLFNSSEAGFLENFARAEDNITEEGEAETIAAIDRLYRGYVLLFEGLQQEAPQNAGLFYVSQVKPSFEATKAACRDLLQINQSAMLRADTVARKHSDYAIYSSIAVSALVVIFGLVFGLKISDFLVKPLQRFARAAREIGEGKLNYALQEQSDDEIGIVSREFNRMAARLSQYRAMDLERLTAEQRKSGVIVDTIDDCIIVTDRENRITLINPAAESVFGKTEQEARGKHFLEVVHDERLFGLVKMTLAQGIGPAEEDTGRPLTVDREGSVRAFRQRISPLKTESGGLTGVVTVLQDITHLYEIDRMKSDFVSAVSHEFRTPLTSMLMAVGLLLDGTAGEINDKQRQLLRSTDEDVRRLTNLVNNLLDLSRIESGKLELDIVPVEPRNIIDESLDLFRQQIEERGVVVVRDYQDSHITVGADSKKIKLVLGNLLGNALHYTEPGGKIRVGAARKEDQVRIWVEDTGPGVPKAYRERIFEKFFQIKRKGLIGAGGAGLGLAIAKEIVEAHGGRIWVESTEGKGSKFVFTLSVVGGVGAEGGDDGQEGSSG